MKRNTRAEKAQETLRIIEDGSYHTGETKTFVGEDIKLSVEQAKLYRSEEFEPVLNNANEKIKLLKHKPEILIINTTVLTAATAMVNKGNKVGCLNFASAKNPGGGFLGGAQAQEESLALSSALYPTLMKHFEMYEHNRSRSTYLYSDYMIYSPGVVMFRNDDGDLLEKPYKMDFITSPAVNIGAMKNNRLEEMAYARETMLRRMDKVFSLFVEHGIEHILLGAWGCGVFQNDPQDIAAYFASFLLNEGKYSTCFKSVVFAVLDRSKDGKNISAFEKTFSDKLNT